MSIKGKGVPATGPVLKNAAAAPFVYFDAAPAYGVLNGVLEVELAGRMLMPKLDGQTVGADFVSVAHLRCSPAAALALMQALSSCLDMQKKNPPAQTEQSLHS